MTVMFHWSLRSHRRPLTGTGKPLADRSEFICAIVEISKEGKLQHESYGKEDLGRGRHEHGFCRNWARVRAGAYRAER